jgi:hypothetical protein
MSTKVLLKKSSVLGKVPLAGDLDYGEVALNYADGKLYFKDSNNDISNIGKNADTANSLQTARSISISGAATGSTLFDGSSDVDIALTLAPNSITLGTDTNGDYVSNIISGSAIDVVNIPLYGYGANAWSINHADTSDVSDLTQSTGTFVSGLSFDGLGHVIGYTTDYINATDTNTTYSISAELAASGVDLRLTGSDTITDNVSIVGGAGITVERIDASTINISSQSPTTTDFIDLTDTVLNTIDSFDKNVYRTAKYLIQAVNGTEVHCTEVLITHNNTDVFITEYATMYSGTSLMTISASIDATTVYLEATADYNNTNIDFVRTTISRISAGGDLEGDLMTQSGTEDLMTGTGTVDLNV